MTAATDVLIVGGGPAGSTCAWALRRAGLDVVVWDRQPFPRDKPCAGWITPHVVAALDVDLEAYVATGRTMQPILGFQVGRQGHEKLRAHAAEFLAWLGPRRGRAQSGSRERPVDSRPAT